MTRPLLPSIPACGLLLALTGTAAEAGEPAAALLAQPCLGCHVENYQPDNPMPRLGGLGAAQIEAALLAYKRGEREATIMDRIAKGYSDAQLAAIAAYLGRKD